MQRETHIIDATNQRLGRLATRVTVLLRGKQKSNFALHVDGGDFVLIKNIEKLQLSKTKRKQKIYYSHSGYLGGLKKQTLEELFTKRPSEVLREAVMGMLPKTKLRSEQIKRMKFE